jgi:hypothetical protein
MGVFEVVFRIFFDFFGFYLAKELAENKRKHEDSALSIQSRFFWFFSGLMGGFSFAISCLWDLWREERHKGGPVTKNFDCLSSGLLPKLFFSPLHFFPNTECLERWRWSTWRWSVLAAVGFGRGGLGYFLDRSAIPL